MEPGLLACWGERWLHTALLQADGRLAQRLRWSADAPGVAALSQALAAAPCQVRHAALMVQADVAPPAEALRQTLGLARVELLQRAQALALAAPSRAAPHHVLLGSARPAVIDVLCDLGPDAPTLATREGHSPAALSALLRQPWPLHHSCRVIGDALRSADPTQAAEALGMLCGLLALAGHRSILIHGPAPLRNALAGWDWASRLARFQAAAPAIAWWDDEGDSKPDACLAGAAAHLTRYLHAMPSGVCEQIRASYGRLTRTEKRVAEVVLADPAAALETATARLAEAAEVSQPQVIRFCRALGFEGVSSFKRALGASLAVSAHGDARAAP